MRKKLIALALSAVCAVSALAPAAGAMEDYTTYGWALQSMGVMKGDIYGNLTLNDTSTRIQGLIMLLRLTGQDAAAQAATGSIPFTDVPDWCRPYVAYAYQHNITQGMSDVLFGTDEEMTQQMYMTFLLRSLGYSESAGDFTYDTANDKAASIKLIKEEEVPMLAKETHFYRGYLAYYSFQALFLPMKAQPTTSLVEYLSAKYGLDVTPALANDTFAAYYNRVISD